VTPAPAVTAVPKSPPDPPVTVATTGAAAPSAPIVAPTAPATIHLGPRNRDHEPAADVHPDWTHLTQRPCAIAEVRAGFDGLNKAGRWILFGWSTANGRSPDRRRDPLTTRSSASDAAVTPRPSSVPTLAQAEYSFR